MTWLDEIDAAAEKATPGPWHTGGTFNPDTDPTQHVWSKAPPGYQSGDQVAQHMTLSDAAYIAACSPERIRALIACVRAADDWIVAGQSPRYDAARIALDLTP